MQWGSAFHQAQAAVVMKGNGLPFLAGLAAFNLHPAWLWFGHFWPFRPVGDESADRLEDCAFDREPRQFRSGAGWGEYPATASRLAGRKEGGVQTARPQSPVIEAVIA